MLKIFMEALKGRANCQDIHVNDAIADYYLNKDVDLAHGSCVFIFELPFLVDFLNEPLQQKSCSASAGFIEALNSLGHNLVKPVQVQPPVPKPSKSKQRRLKKQAQKALEDLLEKQRIEELEKQEAQALSAKKEDLHSRVQRAKERARRKAIDNQRKSKKGR